MNRTKNLILIFFVGAAVLCVTPPTFSACNLYLPGPVTMTVDVHEYEACNTLANFTSYFSATLTDVPVGSSVPAGSYDGFCADLSGDLLDDFFFGATYQIQFFSSLDPSLPLSLQQVTSIYTGNTYTIPWDKINYVLNKYPIPVNSWLDVQAAIWSLVHDGCTPQSDPTLFDCVPERSKPYFFPYGNLQPYGCPPTGIVNKANVQYIVQDANSTGSGFTPGSNELFALIAKIETCSGNDTYCSRPKQIIFIPGRCGEACYEETAFAKGGWIFARDQKANPQSLHSLELSKQQWGWAINLTATGTTTYDIWAGAGLNKTADLGNPDAKKVGRLTVGWDGANATITYTMFAGYYLEEVHLYAADRRPRSTAPGRFGYPTGGYNVGGVPNYSITVPLADANGDAGVWLIAHAVVSNGMCN